MRSRPSTIWSWPISTRLLPTTSLTAKRLTSPFGRETPSLKRCDNRRRRSLRKGFRGRRDGGSSILSRRRCPPVSGLLSHPRFPAVQSNCAPPLRPPPVWWAGPLRMLGALRGPDGGADLPNAAPRSAFGPAARRPAGPWGASFLGPSGPVRAAGGLGAEAEGDGNRHVHRYRRPAVSARPKFLSRHRVEGRLVERVVPALPSGVGIVRRARMRTGARGPRTGGWGVHSSAARRSHPGTCRASRRGARRSVSLPVPGPTTASARRAAPGRGAHRARTATARCPSARGRSGS